MIEYIDGGRGCYGFHDKCEHHHDCCDNHCFLHNIVQNMQNIHDVLMTHMSRKSIHTPKDEIIKLINDSIDDLLNSIDDRDYLTVDQVHDEFERLIEEQRFLKEIPKDITDNISNILASINRIQQTISRFNYCTLEDAIREDNQIRQDIDSKLKNYVLKDEISDFITKDDIPKYSDITVATVSKIGGFKIGFNESGDNYAVKIKDEQAFVTVPKSQIGVSVNPELFSGSKVKIATIDGTEIYAPKYEGSGDNEGTIPSVVSTVYVKIFAKANERGEAPYFSPSAGSYDFSSGRITPPNSSWKTSLQGFNLATDKIFYTWRTFYSDNTPSTWHTPAIRLITTETLIDDIASYYSNSKGVAIYKASETKPSKPEKGEVVEYVDNSNFSKPENWEYTIEAAKKKNNSNKVWVSYNNFIITYNNGSITSVELNEWTDPIEYIDIDSIINSATDKAVEISTAALTNAEHALYDALGVLSGRVSDNKELINANSSLIQDLNGNDIQGAIDGIVKIYSWTEYDGNVSEIPLDSIVVTDAASLNDLNLTYVGSDYFNKYTQIGNKWYIYTATSLSILSQVAELNKQIKTLNTTQEKITAEGYEISVVSKALEDNSIRTSFMQMLKNQINFVVTQDLDADGQPDKSSTIRLSIEDNNSKTEISSDKIILNGSVIAAAIATKELNINNATYLKKDGTLITASGTNGTSQFNPDGSGQLAGGLIKWGNGKQVYGTIFDGDSKTFVTKIRGHIDAYSGHIGYGKTNNKDGWIIGSIVDNDVEIPSMVAKDSTGRELQLSTQYIGQFNGTDNYDWQLNIDGSGHLSGGNIWWNREGDAHFEGVIDAKDSKFKGTVEATDGKFHGAVEATSLSVIKGRQPVIKIALWTKDEAEQNKDKSNIPVGTPVIRAYYEGQWYYVNLIRLETSATESNPYTSIPCRIISGSVDVTKNITLNDVIKYNTLDNKYYTDNNTNLFDGSVITNVFYKAMPVLYDHYYADLTNNSQICDCALMNCMVIELQTINQGVKEEEPFYIYCSKTFTRTNVYGALQIGSSYRVCNVMLNYKKINVWSTSSNPTYIEYENLSGDLILNIDNVKSYFTTNDFADIRIFISELNLLVDPNKDSSSLSN